MTPRQHSRDGHALCISDDEDCANDRGRAIGLYDGSGYDLTVRCMCCQQKCESG
jgi:hypothetical protein